MPNEPSVAEIEQPTETPENLSEVQEFVRQLIIAEKNFQLYPVHGKVVQESLDTLARSMSKCFETDEAFRLEITSAQIRYCETPLYDEPIKSRSVAFRIYKDGIREIAFQDGCTREEIESFLSALSEARQLDDEDDDFITLFWEKDAAHIHAHLADDLLAAEDLPEVPADRSALLAIDRQRFEIPEEEKSRLEEVLESHTAGETADEGDSTFELTDEERESLLQLVRNEDTYFPIFDFLDILVELMVRKSDLESFDKAVRMIRSIIESLFQSFDFERAALLMVKFSQGGHPSLSDSQRRALADMVESFRDKQTIETLRSYLTDREDVDANDPVFTCMKAFPRSAATDFCSFLELHQHLKPLSEVLVHLGTGRPELFSKQLENPDPLVVRALIGVLVKSNGDGAAASIAKALSHGDENVRIHAARTILESPDPSVGKYFIPLLGESSRQLLYLALQFFIKSPTPDAYAPLASLVTGSRLLQLDAKRRIQAFRALVASSPAKAIDLLKSKILRWPWAFTQGAKLRKGAALESLAYSESDLALDLLARLSTRKGFLGTVATRALRDQEKHFQSISRDEATPRARPQTRDRRPRKEVTRV